MLHKRLGFVIPVVILIALILFFVVRLFLPASITNAGSLFDALTTFSCKAKLSFGDMDATAQVTRSADGSIRVTVLEPDTLSGLQFDFANDNISLNYKGLKLDVEPSSFLASSAAGAIANSIVAAVTDKDNSVTHKDGIVTVASKSDSGSFTLTLDEKTGALKTLNVPALDLNCDFSDFSKSIASSDSSSSK